MQLQLFIPQLTSTFIVEIKVSPYLNYGDAETAKKGPSLVRAIKFQNLEK